MIPLGGKVTLVSILLHLLSNFVIPLGGKITIIVNYVWFLAYPPDVSDKRDVFLPF